MRTVAYEYKPIQLIAPQIMSATVTGSAVALGSGEEGDAVAVVSLGAVAGSPTSTLLTVTISASDASAGTYTTLGTMGSNTANVTASQTGTQAITINTGKYKYVKAVVGINWNGGTNPSVACGVSLLLRQTIATNSIVDLATA